MELYGGKVEECGNVWWNSRTVWWNRGAVWSNNVKEYGGTLLNSMVEEWWCGTVKQCGNSLVEQWNSTVEQWNSVQQY